jgi:hypothetical protein
VVLRVAVGPVPIVLLKSLCDSASSGKRLPKDACRFFPVPAEAVPQDLAHGLVFSFLATITSLAWFSLSLIHPVLASLRVLGRHLVQCFAIKVAMGL